MNIRHLIFDLDGTLWDTSKVSAEAYDHALRQDGRCDLAVTADTIKREFGRSLRQIADDLFPGFDQPTRDTLICKCDRANTALLRETDRPMLYPDVRDTFAGLSKSNRLYIVSNCQSGYIEMFLDKYGLWSYITDIECCGNTGKDKADNIRLLLERNGIDAAIYVGDTAKDQEAATIAGIPFVFASYGYGSVSQSCHVIEHLSDLLQKPDLW